MDKVRALKKKNQDQRRRASHAGFEAPKVEDLTKRRTSLPANLHKRDEDEARKLHNSAAYVNIIEEMTSVKLIAKAMRHNAGIQLPKKHAMDPFLQKQLRARKNSIVLPGVVGSIENVQAEPVLKRAISVEAMQKDKIDRDLINIGRSSSESLLGGIDVQDPEDNELSDEENVEIQASA